MSIKSSTLRRCLSREDSATGIAINGVRQRALEGSFKYAVANGVGVVPPNALPYPWQKPEALPRHFTIVGTGKIAMDVGVWLLKCGARAESPGGSCHATRG